MESICSGGSEVKAQPASDHCAGYSQGEVSDSSGGSSFCKSATRESSRETDEYPDRK